MWSGTIKSSENALKKEKKMKGLRKWEGWKIQIDGYEDIDIENRESNKLKQAALDR